ncbi:MAG: magnesium/cobalt transporter CorA [Saprospiraceae bacterium]
MIKYFSLTAGEGILQNDIKIVPENIIWVDLIAATKEEKIYVESIFKVELFTKQEIEEIETSSKYVETEGEIGININFIKTDDDHLRNEAVSFIINGNILITQRDLEFRAFDDTYKKLKTHKVYDGDDIYILLLDTRIDYDADLIESVTARINAVSNDILLDRIYNQDMLINVAKLQNKIIVIRENIVEKQRIISAMMKSKLFPKEDYEVMAIMLSDISSLLDHTNFNFERLEYLQNTFLGLIDMEQNKVIKLFTVLTVIFMPPTLIASMYGMNFKFMPELNYHFGYPLALIMMLGSSMLTLWFFKRKKWI